MPNSTGPVGSTGGPINPQDTTSGALDAPLQSIADSVEQNMVGMTLEESVDVSSQLLPNPEMTPGYAWRTMAFSERPTFETLYDEANAIRPFQRRIAKEEKSKAKKEPQKISPEEYKALRKVTDKFLHELDNIRVERSHWRDRGLDRREREYLDLRSNRREHRAADYYFSEFPIQLTTIHPTTRKELREWLRFGIDGLGENNTYCCMCTREVSEDIGFLMNRRIYCAEHLPQMRPCVMCGELREYKQLQTYDGHQVNACAACLSRTCRRCHKKVEAKFVTAKLCGACIEVTQNVEYLHNRPFSSSLFWVGKEQGEIVKSTRMFSAEVEMVIGTSDGVKHIYDAYDPRGGISGDASIVGFGHGLELQTPRLAGKRGEEFMHRMGKVLRKAGATVNTSCGLHIHLDAGDFISDDRRFFPGKLVELWKAYLVFEDVIQSFIPYERRRNRYCRPLSTAFSLVDLEEIDTMVDAERLWYKQDHSPDIESMKRHHHHSSRYFGINFHSLFSGGHLEVRYHSGTTNAKKIMRWANLHARFMDAARDGIFSHEVLRDANACSLQEKTNMLFGLLQFAQADRNYFTERQKKFSNKANHE